MPHFGLMQTGESFDAPEGARQRARLHLRAARRRLRQGKIAAGIATLADALIFALRWYLTDPECKRSLRLEPTLDLMNEQAMLRTLREAGIVDHAFDLDAFNRLVDRATREEMPGYDYRAVLEAFELLMTRLKVMPFDEGRLPPEDPSTF